MDRIHHVSRQIACILDPKGLGTGLIVGPDGWLLTNKHVAPSAGPYRVILADGRNVAGVGVHQSPHRDLAVVKIAIDTPDHFDLETSVAEEFAVGTDVFAIGHPRGCRFSVSRGIVSNNYRLIDDEYYVQTDVAINPGNSGGPLLDQNGKLVGVVAMMAAHSQGLGFAVPGALAADYVREVRRLIRNAIVHVPAALLAEAQEKQHGSEGNVREGIEQLVATGRAEVVMQEEGAPPPDGQEMKLRRGKTQAKVSWTDGVLVARARVAALGPQESRDAQLLYKLLEINGSPELGGATLGILDGAVDVTIRWPVERLTAVDAFGLVDRVIELGALWSERVGHMVYGSPAPAFGAQWQQAPAPQQPPQQPWGQPPQQAQPPQQQWGQPPQPQPPPAPQQPPQQPWGQPAPQAQPPQPPPPPAQQPPPPPQQQQGISTGQNVIAGPARKPVFGGGIPGWPPPDGERK